MILVEDTDVKELKLKFINQEMYYTSKGDDLIEISGLANDNKTNLVVYAHPKLVKSKFKKGDAITMFVFISKNNKLYLVNEI